MIKLIVLSVGVASGLAAVVALNIPLIVDHFAVDVSFRPLATQYIAIGVFNMILTSIYGIIDGIIVASGRFRTSLAFAACLLAGNVLLDWIGIFGINASLSADVTPVRNSMMFIGLSTTVLLGAMISIAFGVIRGEFQTTESAPFKDILPVWIPELGTALIRAIAPLIFAYQVGLMVANEGFIVTYNLALHLAYICCLPLSASIPIAVRRASRANSGAAAGDDHLWKTDLLAGGLLPTAILLLAMSILAMPIMNIVFGYHVPVTHLNFLPLYFVAVAIGQFGNYMTVPLRARILSHLVTRNFFLAEIGVQLGICQILIWSGNARPDTLPYVTLAFTTSYAAMTIASLRVTRPIADFTFESRGA